MVPGMSVMYTYSSPIASPLSPAISDEHRVSFMSLYVRIVASKELKLRLYDTECEGGTLIEAEHVIDDDSVVDHELSVLLLLSVLVPLPSDNALFVPHVELEDSDVVIVVSCVQLSSRESETARPTESTSARPMENSALVPIVNEPPSEFDSDCDKSLPVSSVSPH